MTTPTAPPPLNAPSPYAENAATRAAALAEARARKQDAIGRKQAAAGIVLAVAAAHADALPPAVAGALARYERAVDECEIVSAIAADLGRHVAQTTPAIVHDAVARQRLDAMIAHDVAGSVLVVSSAQEGWRATFKVVEPDTGKHKPVPNYSSDLTAVAASERRLTSAVELDAYGKALAHETRDTPGTFSVRLAMASPMARARALVRAVGMDPDNPPAWVRNMTPPGTP